MGATGCCHSTVQTRVYSALLADRYPLGIQMKRSSLHQPVQLNSPELLVNSNAGKDVGSVSVGDVGRAVGRVPVSLKQPPEELQFLGRPVLALHTPLHLCCSYSGEKRLLPLTAEAP